MLEIANLEVVYQSVARVVRGISLRVPDGSVVALLGPNGAGKSTTVRAVTGLLDIHDGEATKGSVSFDGLDLLDRSPEDIARAGVVQVMEGRRVFVELTVEDNLRSGAYTRSRREAADAVQGAYRRFPVLEERRRQRAGYLSGGEQQMLAMARALLVDPRLLVLDEPSLGLAPRIVAQVAEVIRSVRDRGVSVLLIEQNAALALELSDHGYVMENGRIVLDGPPRELEADADFREFYLGLGAEGRRSYRDVKLYRRRKRWLS